MKLTEGQIRELIRIELNGSDSSYKLNEFKELLRALSGIFKELGGVLSTGFGKAVSAYQNANKATYTSTKGKSKDKLSPKTDAYDQVYALGDVLWHIDSAVDLSIQQMEYGVEKLNLLNIPVEADDAEFGTTLSEAGGNISEAVGYFSGYLSKAQSSKISDVGSGIQPGETLTDTLRNFAQGVSEVERLNPLADWENIKSSEAVENVLDKDDEDAENMKNLINQIEGNNIRNIDRLGDLKSLIDEANSIAVTAEQVVDTAAEETGVAPESSDLLDHNILLRPLIREIMLEK